MRTFKRFLSVIRTRGPRQGQDRSNSGRLQSGLKLNSFGAKRIDQVRLFDNFRTFLKEN